MKSWTGAAGAIACTAVWVVAIMTVLLLFPLGLAAVLPSARLTVNWTLLGVATSALAMFLAGLAVNPLVTALGLFTEAFRRQAVITWTRRGLEFLMLVAWYALFIAPLTMAVTSAIVASAFVALTEPLLDHVLARQEENQHPR